ncbi:MAG TPA: NTP transferase domain-containing protein [Gaiellaceae bacterium]
MIGAVVLAAGASTRYGRPKQRELLPAVLDALGRSPVDEVVVVAGAHELELEARAGARLVQADDWPDGPGASLRAGLAALGDPVSHALVVLADGPELDPRAVERVIEHRSNGPVVAASYDGTRSHPVVLARSTWSSMPDDGGRALDPVLVDCSDLRPPGDVDYPPTRVR